MKSVTVSRFKSQCLALLEDVRKKRERLLITKRGKPLAEVIPVSADSTAKGGWLRGTILYEGDIVSPLGISWKAAQ